MSFNRSFGLAKALYRVTDRLHDSEPLKWRLRTAALLVSDCANDRENLPEEHTKRLSSSINTILQLLDLAAETSYVSRINYETLLREYATMSTILLPKTSFDVEETHQENEKSGNESAVHQTERQGTILKFLQEKKAASIGDIVSHMGNSTSEKTIQRDLASLVVQGHVSIEGDKRWRRYFLNEKREDISDTEKSPI